MAGKGKEEQAAAAPVASVPEENSASSATDEYQAEEEEEQKRLQSILSNMRRVSNLYSEMELLRVVEDYVTDCMVHLGYQEHRLFSNIRLLVATFACCIAAYASFGIPVATDGPSLKLSIAAFFGSLLVLLLVETLWVKNAIACFKDKDGDSFFIDSHIDRSSNELVLAIRQKSLHLSTASNVGRFFDSKGYLLIDTLYEELTKLLQDFENGLTDTAKKGIPSGMMCLPSHPPVPSVTFSETARDLESVHTLGVSANTYLPLRLPVHRIAPGPSTSGKSRIPFISPHSRNYLGATVLFLKREKSIKGNVVFIFQHDTDKKRSPGFCLRLTTDTAAFSQKS